MLELQIVPYKVKAKAKTEDVEEVKSATNVEEVKSPVKDVG